jgi:hypothetical protein
MFSEAKAESYPSVFTIAVVFGGTLGMTIASLAGYEGGAGFLLGAAAVFLALGSVVLIARHREQLVHDAVVMSAVAAASGLSVAEFSAIVKKHRSYFQQRFIDEAVLNVSKDAIHDVVAEEAGELSEHQRHVLQEKLEKILEQYMNAKDGGTDWPSSSGASN